MASTTTDLYPGRSLRTRLEAFFLRLAEASPTYRSLEHYSAMSDAELARRGMTRRDVPERVLGPRVYT